MYFAALKLQPGSATLRQRMTGNVSTAIGMWPLGSPVLSTSGLCPPVKILLLFKAAFEIATVIALTTEPQAEGKNVKLL
jgi:hypothetical protein